MFKSIKTIAAGVGMAAVLAAGLCAVATQAPDNSTGTFVSSGAGDTSTMSPDPTTLDTPSFKPAAKATVPCGFAETGGC